MLNLATDTARVPALPPERSPGYWKTVGRRFVRDPMALVAGAMILFLLLLAAFGPWLASADPYASSMLNRLKPIGTEGHPLGAVGIGRQRPEVLEFADRSRGIGRGTHGGMVTRPGIHRQPGRPSRPHGGGRWPCRPVGISGASVPGLSCTARRGGRDHRRPHQETFTPCRSNH